MKDCLVKLSFYLLTIIVANAAVGVTRSAVIAKGFRAGKPANPTLIIVEPYPPTVLGIEFTEGSGSTLTTSFGPSLTMSGGMNWITGASGSGYAIGTTGDETATTDSVVTFSNNKITITAWLNCANWSAAPGDIVKTEAYGSTANGFRLRMTGDGNVFTMAINGDTASNQSKWQFNDSLQANTWQHIACVFDGSVGGGGTIVFYYNGAVTTVGQSTSDRDGTSNFADAKIIIGSTESLDVKIDDLRIYSSALNAAQIRQIYLNPR